MNFWLGYWLWSQVIHRAGHAEIPFLKQKYTSVHGKQNPHSDVEFPLIYKQRTFHVLLYNKTCWLNGSSSLTFRDTLLLHFDFFQFSLCIDSSKTTPHLVVHWILRCVFIHQSCKLLNFIENVNPDASIEACRFKNPNIMAVTMRIRHDEFCTLACWSKAISEFY